MPLRTLPLALALLATAIAQAGPAAIPTDRTFDRLPAPGPDGGRETLRAAARTLDGWPIDLAGVPIDGALLADLAATAADEPLLRAVRERIGRPVDLEDFLYFLDDLAVARANGAPAAEIFIPSGRARAAGILLHPGDVFGDRPRHYGTRPLAIFRPERPAALEPAPDGAPLGARWTARYRNPQEEEAMLAALEEAGRPGFADRLRDLLGQFRAQGAQAWVFSTVRSRERGYLIYGSFILSRADTRAEVGTRVAELERLNDEWDLDVPIDWDHPDGWQATGTAAREMAAAYNVVYATRRGARFSSHYGGRAADFAAMDLPRTVVLQGPDGGPERTFDLTAPSEPRDLNLTPRMIEWVERHFGLRKLRSDYPHWTDRGGG
jgi:hypothetical protein